MKKIALLLLCLTIPVYAGVVKYSGSSNLNFSTDSSGYPPRPAWVNINDNSLADTGRVLTPDSSELIWPYQYKDTLGTVQEDSTKCLIELLVANNDPTYNPSGYVNWVDQNGFVTSEPIQWGPSYAVHLTDTIVGLVVVVVGSGSGAYQDTIRVVDTSAVVDDTLTNVRVVVADYSRTRKADLTIDGSGVGIANLDNEALTFRVNANWYFQEAGVDSIVAPAKDTAFTLYVYNLSVLAPGSSDSTTLVLYLPNQSYRVRVTPLLQEEGHADTSGLLISNEPVYGSPAAVTFAAEVTVLRSTSATPPLPYEIVVYHKDTQAQLVKLTRYFTDDTAVSVVTW